LDNAEVEFFREIVPLIGTAVRRITLPRSIRRICAVDAAYSTKGNRVLAAAVLFSKGELKETSLYSGSFTFPYVSGLFFLHEGPFVVRAVKQLKAKPDLVCFDAHGEAHPQFKGLATICGMVLGIPSVGIAKSPLVNGEVLPYRKGLARIRVGQRTVGFATAPPKRYWSPGYGVSIIQLEKIILSKKRQVCLGALQEAHKVSKREMASWKPAAFSSGS
jgi:deoxyinosine 3'endonuclease (endonuclease V)